MQNNLISLLDAYDAAKAQTDTMWLHSGDSDAAEAAHQVAICAEEAVVDAAIKAFRAMQPELDYQTARGMITISAYQAKLRAIYGGA